MSKVSRGDFGSTLFFLMGQYGMRAVIPAEEVCRDYFGHLAPGKFIRKCDDGSIPLPLMRSENSQKGSRGVHIQDLANYIESQRAEALKNMPRYDAGTTLPTVETSTG
jgi:Pyocin activator protein PrtN